MQLHISSLVQVIDATVAACVDLLFLTNSNMNGVSQHSYQVQINPVAPCNSTFGQQNESCSGIIQTLIEINYLDLI